MGRVASISGEGMMMMMMMMDAAVTCEKQMIRKVST